MDCLSGEIMDYLSSEKMGALDSFSVFKGGL